MVYRGTNKILTLILPSALILLFISDGINKFFQIRSAQLNADGDMFADSFSASIFVRFTYQLIFIFLIYWFYDKERGKGVMLLFGIICLFLLGQFTFLLTYRDANYSLGHHLTLFNKYLYVFIIFYAIKDIVYDKTLLKKLASILEYLFVFNSILIFIGLVFKVDLFKSYFSQDLRFGYNGLIPSVNEATLFYMVGISLLYFRYIKEGKCFWSLWICIISTLPMGAKAMYLFLLLLLMYHIVIRANLIQKVVSIIVIVGGVIAILPTLLSAKYSFLFDFFIYQYEKYGLLFMITSGRSTIFMLRFAENLNFWSWINYFIGGTDQYKYYIEMDFFDSFLFLGILGTILLLILYFNTIFKNIKFKSFRFFFCFAFFSIAFMVGHFFSSALNALYLNIALIYIYSYEQQIEEAAV